MNQTELDDFWADAKVRAGLNPTSGLTGQNVADTVPPAAWACGADPATADELLALVLDGVKTGTASALWDYEAAGEPVPEVGDLSIILDGAAHPRVLIRTTSVRVVPFSAVDGEHARSEGEGDRTLDYWRETHRRYFAENAEHGRGFAEDMPVVLERFEVLVPAAARRKAQRNA